MPNRALRRQTPAEERKGRGTGENWCLPSLDHPLLREPQRTIRRRQTLEKTPAGMSDQSPREVLIRNTSRAARVDAEAVKMLVHDLADHYRTNKGCSIVFVGDQRMRRYNGLYRAVNRTTDVLSFPSELNDYLGDVIVSLPRVLEQAQNSCRPADEEARWLIIHGFLHLLGYDHESDRGQMRRCERRLMKRIRPRRLIRTE